MCWWNKKKQQEEKKPIPCNHHYRDFPWYTHTTFNPSNQTMNVDLFKPYICIHCGDRKDVKLCWNYGMNYKGKTIDEAKYEWLKYNGYDKYVKPKAFVEDMIHDMLLVDKEYLDIYEKIYNNKGDLNV